MARLLSPLPEHNDSYYTFISFIPPQKKDIWLKKWMVWYIIITQWLSLCEEQKSARSAARSAVGSWGCLNRRCTVGSKNHEKPPVSHVLPYMHVQKAKMYYIHLHTVIVCNFFHRYLWAWFHHHCCQLLAGWLYPDDPAKSQNFKSLSVYNTVAHI